MMEVVDDDHIAVIIVYDCVTIEVIEVDLLQYELVVLHIFLFLAQIS